MAAGYPPLARVLSKLVVEALAQIGLTQDDILAGQIEFTNLPWQVPPLVVEATLFGIPFSNYTDQAIYVNTSNMAMLWSDALGDMKNNPHRVVDENGYRSTSKAIPHVRLRERALYLSMPEGYPQGITDLAATILSLECAHLMRTNTKLQSFVADEDNYYAVMETGMQLGIKDGLPTMYEDVWDLPSSGMVQEMLRMPRGSVFEGCDYDIIAKVRSLAHTYNRALRDYEALEWAIQALRVVGGQKELLDAVMSIRRTVYARKSRLDALREANEVVNRISLTDRQRIEMLKHLLVPEIMASGQFSQSIYSFSKVPPPVLTEKVLDRIRSAVNQLHSNEEMLYAPSTKPERSV